MDDIFNKDDVEKFGNEVLLNIKDKIDNIADDFYSKYQSYLYEHYDNFKASLEEKLIRQICETYVTNPYDYKYLALRDKLWFEHKNEIISGITEEKIKETIDIILNKYTHRVVAFPHCWDANIARFISEHLDLFKKNDDFNSAFGNLIHQKDDEIKYLNDKINRFKNSFGELE
ncbi:MAG: hypothetical protein M0R06_02025 [Sphaerochaeta sp.]|jgi:hypothetical protein|nr:hypothetical protein [Sphaerochaeta sp.]